MYIYIYIYIYARAEVNFDQKDSWPSSNGAPFASFAR
jgi:hypothetical protein